MTHAAFDSSSVLIRVAALSDLDGWVRLRTQLWVDKSFNEHRSEAASMLAKPISEHVAFVAVNDAGTVCAFAEAALRHDYVNGCETSPVAFLEGIYVRPETRRSGLGKGLSVAIQSWARERGCTEIASDAQLANVESHAFQMATGFEETERVVYFRKRL